MGVPPQSSSSARPFALLPSRGTSIPGICSLAAESADSSVSDDLNQIVVTAAKTTQSSVALGGVEAQKILLGISPLKAIETLPGVVYETADPWGNNEQNAASQSRKPDSPSGN